MANILATFTGVDAAILGPADTGQEFTLYAGAVSRTSNRAVPTTLAAFGGYDAVSVDGEVSVDIGTGGGYALYFRITDAANWWRLYNRIYFYSVIVGYTATEYRWRYSYTGSVSSGVLHSEILYSGWSTDPANPGGNPSYVHTHGGVTHTMSLIVSSQETRGGDPIYGSQTGYDVRLDRCTGGAVQVVKTASPSSNPASLRVVLNKSTITAYTNLSPAALFSTTDAFNSDATRHGIGGAADTQSGIGTGFDNFKVTVSSASGLAMVI